MSPLRVLYVLNASGGGATQGILELLRGLPGDQYEAYLAVPNEPEFRQQQLFSQLAAATYVVPMSWWNRKLTLPAWWRLMAWGSSTARTLAHLRPVTTLCNLIRRHQIDLVYTTTALTLDGALAARVCKVPHIWHIKERIGQRGRVKFLLPDMLLARLMVALSDRIIVMSHFINDFFEHQGLAQQIEVISDGVDLGQFNSDHGAELRKQLGVQPNQLLIGMAADLGAVWKQHRLFFDMAARITNQFPEIRFGVFGRPPSRQSNPAYNRPWSYYQELHQYVHELGLEDRVLWAGFHSDIAQMMSALDILVHPCDTEPFGRVAIEAMAAYRPVIGPSAGGIAETVLDKVTGLLVAPRQEGAFSHAVSRLATNARMRRSLGEAGHKHVAANYSIGQHIKRITELYATVRSRARDI